MLADADAALPGSSLIGPMGEEGEAMKKGTTSYTVSGGLTLK